MPRWHWVAAESLAQLTGPFAMMSSPCHRFWRIFGVACSRVAEEVVSLCLRSSSDRLVGRGLVLVRLMRTPPLEVCRQLAQLVVGQRADSPSLRELDVWHVAGAEGLVATLAPRKVQYLLRTLLGGASRSR